MLEHHQEEGIDITDLQINSSGIGHAVPDDESLNQRVENTDLSNFKK